MRKMIDLDKLNELLEDYKQYKHKEESFEEFIEVNTDNGEPVWNWVDSVGIVMKGDFENAFKDDFIEKNFEDLAYAWFNGLNSQVDFGILLSCLKDEDKFKKGLKEKERRRK
jgi:hypothetical protein